MVYDVTRRHLGSGKFVGWRVTNGVRYAIVNGVGASSIHVREDHLRKGWVRYRFVGDQEMADRLAALRVLKRNIVNMKKRLASTKTTERELRQQIQKARYEETRAERFFATQADKLGIDPEKLKSLISESRRVVGEEAAA